MPNYSYDDVLDRWDKARAFGETRSLPEYAQHLNELYDTQDFSAGLRDGPWTRFSHRADQVLRGSPVGEALGEVGAGVGGLFGNEEAGRRVGQDLPRALMETAPLYFAGPEAGLPATALALGGTGGLMAAHTYADTGSPKASLISGVTGAALPGIGHIAGSVGARLAGGEALSGEWLPEFLKKGMPETFGGVLPKTASDVSRVETGRFVGSQLGQFAANEASMYAMHRTLDPNSPFEPLSADFLLQQIPFTVHDAYKHYTSPHSTADDIRPMLKTPEVTPPAPKDYVRPSQPEQEATLAEAMQNVQNVYADPNSTQDEKDAAMKAMTEANLNPEGVAKVKQEVQNTPLTEEQRVLQAKLENVDKVGPNPYGEGNSYRVLADAYSHPEEAPQHNTFFVNGLEPTLKDGMMTFQGGESQFKGATSPLPDRAYRGQEQPNLPPQPQWTPGEYEGGELPQDFSHPLEGQPVEIREPEQKVMVQDMGVEPQKVLQLVDAQQKANNLALDAFQGPIHKDPQGNVVRLGNTTVAADGWMDETRFVKATQLPQGFVEAMRQQYPEAFVNGRVNATALVRGLQERPMLEVKELRGDTLTKEGNINREAALTHELDTRYPGWNEVGRSRQYVGDVEFERLTQELRDIAMEGTVPSEKEAKYSFLGPKPEEKMPGYVEGLVRVPQKALMGQYDAEAGVLPTERERGVQFRGPHFGSEDTNVLAFYRGYEETLPDGRKAFHVIEVQSDWGQDVRKEQDRVAKWSIKERGPNDFTILNQDGEDVSTLGFETRQAAEERLRTIQSGESRSILAAPSHPLLPFYETLALKAAIQHAQKVGAEVVILSDGETAMMTEGHDSAVEQRRWKVTTEHGMVARFATQEEAQRFADSNDGKVVEDQIQEPSQSAGMRLHYDTTLPETLAKLTGEKGVGVELGKHKQAGESGSPVFWKGGKVGGSGKDDITGLAFSLDKIQRGLSTNDTLSLKEAVAKYELAQQNEAAARTQLKTLLTDAKQIASIFGPENSTVGTLIDTRVASGASVSQAVVHEVMRKLGMDVHEAQVEQDVQEDYVHGLMSQYAPHTLAAHDLIRDRALWGEQKTKGVGKGVEPAAEQSKYDTQNPIKDKDGKYFPSRSKAKWYYDQVHSVENPDDNKTYGIINAGKYESGPNKGKERGYYLAAKLNVLESVDKVLPSGTTKAEVMKEYAHEQMEEEHEAAAEELQSRPQATLNLYEKNLNVAERSPQRFANASGFSADEVDHAIKQGRVILGMRLTDLADINRELSKAGLETFDTVAEKNEFMAKLRNGLDEFGGGHPARMNSDAALPLGPEGEKLLQESGVLRGGRAVVQWLASSNDFFGDLFKAFAKHPQLLDQIKFVLPGDKNWIGGYGGFYQPTIDGGEIHINHPEMTDAESVEKWKQILREEITHHMEDQLSARNDPAALEYRKTRSDILKSLRESRELPKKIRDFLQKTLSRGDFDRYVSEGYDYTDSWRAELGEKDFNKYHGVLYGLQNESEMVGAAFSNPYFADLMLKTKPPQKGGIISSVMQWFSEAFGRLAGAKPNALSTLLSGFDNYLSGGVLKNTYNGRDFIRDSLVAKYGTQPEAIASRMQSVDGMYKSGGLGQSISGFTREMEGGMLHPNQSQGPLVQSLRTALVSGESRDVFHGTMDLLAAEVPVHQELWYRMKQDFEITKELLGMVKRGEIAGTVPENMEANLRKSQQKINAMQQALEKQGLALERWNNLDQFEQDGYEKAVIAAAAGRKYTRPQGESGLEEEARGAMGLDKEPEVWKVKRESSLAELEKGKAAKVGDWFRRTFMQTQFLKQQVPEARPVFDHIDQQQADANARMYTSNVAYGYDPSVKGTTNDRWANNVKVANEPRLTRAASDLKLWMNVQEQEGKSVAFDQDFPKQVLGRLSTTDRKAVLDEITSQRARTQVRISETADHLSKVNVEKTSFVIAARESGMKPEQAREISKSIYDSLAMLQQPETQTTGLESLRMLSSQVQPSTYLSALKLSQDLVAAAQKTLDLMRSRPNYTPEQRLQQYHLRMTGPNGETHYSDSDSTSQLNARRKALEEKGWKFNYFTDKADANVPTGDLDQTMFSAMQEMDQLAATRVEAALSDLPPEISARVLPELQRANDYQASLQAAKPIPGAGPKRKFVAGREEINMVKNDHEFQIRFNNYLRHSMTRAQASVDMLDPEILGNTTVKQLVQDHVNNFLSTDNPTVRKFNEYTYYTKLAWNFGVNFLHGVQSLTTGMASVIAETGGVGDAFALTGGAQKAVTKNRFSRITGKGNVWDNPEHQWVMDKAVQEGTGTGIGSWQDLYDPEVAMVQDMNKPMNPLGKGLNFLQQGARKWTGAFLSFNDQVGILAGYDLGRSRGMDQESAYRFAVDMKNRGYYTGGKAQRSVGLWSIKTKAVPQLLSSLQTYTLGWFSQLANNYINGFGTPPRDLTPTQRTGAKKAFLYQLGAQAVLAGALGLPGVGQGLALLKQATGEDVKGMAQQGLAHLFDEDADGGGMLSTLAMHGATAAFTPVDTSGRHMPSFPFIGVSPYKGFDLSTLAPAPVSTTADLVQGLLAAAKGDVDTAFQKSAPHVLQGPYKLWQGEGDIRDKRGALIQTLSPMEKFVTALGMTPARVARAQDTAEAVKRMQANQEQLLGSLADDLAQTQRTQGVDASRQRLRELVQQHPEIDPVKLASEAVNRLVAQSVPVQPQRTVNPAMDLTGLTSQQGPQEGHRFQVQQQGRAAFGLPQLNPAKGIQATMLDQMMQSNPYLPVSTARAMVLGKQQVRRPYSGLDILGTSQ